jgi:hypothetical protein
MRGGNFKGRRPRVALLCITARQTVKVPVAYPEHASPCDLKLPEAALKFRVNYPPPLTCRDSIQS